MDINTLQTQIEQESNIEKIELLARKLRLAFEINAMQNNNEINTVLDELRKKSELYKAVSSVDLLSISDEDKSRLRLDLYKTANVEPVI